MAYTSPSITASGTTFAQLQAGGASGHLERLIAANSFTAAQIRHLRSAKVGRLQEQYRNLSQCLTTWDQGEPIATNTLAKARLFDLHVVFAALNTLCAEAGVLLDANAGTLTTAATPIGTRKGVRTQP